MDELLTKMYENIEEFMDYWKGKSNQTILEMEDFLIASAEKKGWDVTVLKKFLEDTKANTETAKKLQQQEEEKERARQGKEEATKIIEGLKDETNPEKIKEELETIGKIPSQMTTTEAPKAYTSADYEHETKNYDPDKYFCPTLFNALPFPDGTLSVIGARTGRGKTTALINLGLEALTAETPRKVLFITLEMSCRQLYNKLILAKTYAQADTIIRKNHLDKVENPHKVLFKIMKADTAQLAGIDTEFINRVKEAKEFVLNKTNANELQMYQAWSLTQTQIIRLISQQEKGTLVLVDYIQRMPIADTRNRDRYIQIKEISNALMNVSVKSGVVTICGAQFNRVAGVNDDGNDTFDDASFRESGDIEQDAHNATGLGWEADKKTRFYEIIKLREGGETGESFYLEFNGAYSFMNALQLKHIQTKKKTKGKRNTDENETYSELNRNVSGTPI
jgi:replicative DNA helicase